VVTPDGRHLWIHLDVEPFRDEQGEISDFVAVATDITARRRGELALEDRIAKALAESADEADRVPSAVDARPDDLRPPALRSSDASTLEAMMTLARIAEAAEAASHRYPITKSVDAIARTGDLARRQLARFASAVTDSAAREAGSVEPVDLGETLRAICGEVAQQLPSTIAIDAEIEPLETRLRIDRDALHTLFAELMDDAVRAIGSEWGTLSITSGRTEPGQALPSPVHPSTDRLPLGDDEPRLYVEVHDTATSLSRSALDYIHDRTGTPPTDSRSLGLALARARADRVGATLRVHSLPGVGTRVLVYLPGGCA
jgi:signal transduction histidine kinase